VPILGSACLMAVTKPDTVRIARCSFMLDLSAGWGRRPASSVFHVPREGERVCTYHFGYIHTQTMIVVYKTSSLWNQQLS
jgi:hypothetical protein